MIFLAATVAGAADADWAARHRRATRTAAIGAVPGTLVGVGLIPISILADIEEDNVRSFGLVSLTGNVGSAVLLGGAMRATRAVGELGTDVAKGPGYAGWGMLGVSAGFGTLAATGQTWALIPAAVLGAGAQSAGLFQLAAAHNARVDQLDQAWTARYDLAVGIANGGLITGSIGVAGGVAGVLVAVAGWQLLDKRPKGFVDGFFKVIFGSIIFAAGVGGVLISTPVMGIGFGAATLGSLRARDAVKDGGVTVSNVPGITSAVLLAAAPVGASVAMATEQWGLAAGLGGALVASSATASLIQLAVARNGQKQALVLSTGEMKF